MSKRAAKGDVIRRDERQDEFNLYTYELSVRLGTDTASFRLPLYSVKVRATDAFGNVREECVRDAFADSERAIRFYEKLVDGVATPIDLPYVLEDERATN